MAANTYLAQKTMVGFTSLASIGSDEDASAVFSAMGSMYQYMALFYLLMAILYPMMAAGNLKYIIRGQERRLPFYLQFGLDEFRILMTIILLIFMVLLAEIVGLLAIFVLGLIAQMGGKAIGGVIVAVAAVAFFVAMIWLMLRMSLALPATIGVRKIGIAESWRVSEGNVWRLYFYWLLWAIVLLSIMMIYMALVIPSLLPMMQEAITAAGQAPESAQAFHTRWIESQKDLWNMSRSGFWIYAAGSYLFMLIYTALWNVAGGVAYRYLSGEQPSP